MSAMAQHHIVVIVGLAILNGLFSPALSVVFALQSIWYPFFLPASLAVIFMLCSLIVSTVTLMIGGVPAGLYERIAGSGRSSPISGYIWLAGVLFLTLPALPNMMKALGG
jgi:hypothetical protein